MIRKLILVMGLVSALGFPQAGRAELRSTLEIREALADVTPDTLVLFDIDDTVLRSAKGVGSNKWFSQFMREARALGADGPLIERAVSRVFSQINKTSPLRPVDPSTPALIAELRQNGVRVHALTARTPNFISLTQDQMNSLLVSFRRTSAGKITDLGNGTVVNEGVIYSSGLNKGKALARFLDRYQLSPRRIVMIDDSKDHLRDVETEAMKRGIAVQAWQYRGAEAGVERRAEAVSANITPPYSTHISRQLVRSILCEQSF